MGEKIRKRTLCKGCSHRCSIYIEFEDGKPIKIIPDRQDDPKAQLCPRVYALVFERTSHPERLLYPLKRVGERGGGQWQRISWDQALDEIATKLKEIKKNYGAEAITLHAANGFSVSQVARRFLNLVGSPNLMCDGVVCMMDQKKIEEIVWGWSCVYGDHANAGCSVYWGGNPAVTYIKPFRVMKRAKERGGKIIVVDPRFSETARIADLWLQIRPATDGALFLGWLNTIIQEELYDRDFVEKWTNAPYLVRSDTGKLLRESDMRPGGDLDKFVAWDLAISKPVVFSRDSLSYEWPNVRPALTGRYGVKVTNGRKVECTTVWQLLQERVAPYTPERVSEITWIPADRILNSVRMYATNRPANFGRGNAYDGIGRNATQAVHAKIIIGAITGNIDVKGGQIMPGPYTKNRFVVEIEENDKLPLEQKRKTLGADKFKLLSWESYEEMGGYQKKAGFPNPMGSCYTCYAHKPIVWRAMITGKPYPVKACLVACSNPLIGSTNTSIAFEALKSLDLLVVNEIFMTPTADLADYVLPSASTGLESPELHSTYDIRNVIHGADGALDPPGECWTNWKFYRELGVRMGQFWPWKTIEEMYDWQLEYVGYTWKEFAEKVRSIVPPLEFKKYEKTGFGTPSGKVEIYSSHLEKLGYDPLPDYEEPVESPLSTPELAKEYPYILTSHRPPLFRSSSNQELESIRKTRPDSLILIHPDTATNLGVNEGDWVWIESTLGKRIKQKVNLSEGIHPHVVSADIMRWYPQGAWESNLNVLIDDDPDVFCDPTYGSWACRGMLCKIYKA